MRSSHKARVQGSAGRKPLMNMCSQKDGTESLFLGPFNHSLGPGIHLSTLLDLSKSCWEHRRGEDREGQLEAKKRVKTLVIMAHRS